MPSSRASRIPRTPARQWPGAPDPEPQKPPSAFERLVSRVRGKSAGVRIQGMENLMVRYSQCCQPVPGDEVIGYITRGRGVSVHRSDCPSYLRLVSREPQRALPVEWGGARGSHEAGVAVEGVDRKYLLKDVTNLIAQEDAHVNAISSERRRGSAQVRLRLQVRVQDFGQLSRLLGKLEAIPGVERAYRT